MWACGVDCEGPVWAAGGDCGALACRAVPVYGELHRRSADRDADPERNGDRVLRVRALAAGWVRNWRVAVGYGRGTGLVDPAAAGAGSALRCGAAGDMVGGSARALAESQCAADAAAGCDRGAVRGASACPVDRTQLANLPPI